MSSPNSAGAHTPFQDISNNQSLGNYHQPVPILCATVFAVAYVLTCGMYL